MATAIFGVFGLSGCGFGVGDHVFYRVAVDATKSDAGCYKDNMVPKSVAEDMTNLRGSATLVLYIGGDKEVELDTGSAVVPGAKTDTGYKFSGQAVNVEYPVDGIKTTSTTQLTVSMTVDGSTVTGTSTTVTSQKCEGAMCPPDFGSQTCTKTATFKGVEIDQAEVVMGSAPAQNP